MSSLNQYVDHLFRKYRGIKQAEELKLEVLSNLEAKAADLTAAGMTYDEAVQQTKQSITSIDHLIDANQQVYLNPFKLEYVQIGLLYFIVGWIVTMPLLFLHMGGELWNVLLLFAVILTGIFYLVMLRGKKDADYLKPKISINRHKLFRIRTLIWNLWGLFLLVSFLFTTGVQFGSNIWFSRPIHIDGPYQFAQISLSYLLPFISIMIPLLFHQAPKLMQKYEVGEYDEDSE